MEVMAVEELVAAAWELEDFLVCRRHPIWLEEQHSYSDVDLVGVRSRPSEVRIGECKVQSGARTVYCYNGDYEFVDGFMEGWAPFMDNIPLLWDRDLRPDWLPLTTDVQKIQVWFCGNFWFTDEDARRRANRDLTSYLKKTVAPHGAKGKIEGRVYTTLDLILKCIAGVGENTVKWEWGKRYGHPMLDVFRELVRYAHPSPEGGGQIRTEISKKCIERLCAVLGER